MALKNALCAALPGGMLNCSHDISIGGYFGRTGVPLHLRQLAEKQVAADAMNNDKAEEKKRALIIDIALKVHGLSSGFGCRRVVPTSPVRFKRESSADTDVCTISRHPHCFHK